MPNQQLLDEEQVIRRSHANPGWPRGSILRPVDCLLGRDSSFYEATNVAVLMGRDFHIPVRNLRKPESRAQFWYVGRFELVEGGLNNQEVKSWMRSLLLEERGLTNHKIGVPKGRLP